RRSSGSGRRRSLGIPLSHALSLAVSGAVSDIQPIRGANVIQLRRIAVIPPADDAGGKVLLVGDLAPPHLLLPQVADGSKGSVRGLRDAARDAELGIVLEGPLGTDRLDRDVNRGEHEVVVKDRPVDRPQIGGSYRDLRRYGLLDGLGRTHRRAGADRDGIGA